MQQHIKRRATKHYTTCNKTLNDVQQNIKRRATKH